MKSGRKSPDPVGDLFDTIALPMALLDAHGRVVRTNPAWAALMPDGWPADRPPELSACLHVIGAAVVAPGALVRPSAESPKAFRLELQPMGAAQLATLIDVSGELRSLDELKQQHQVRDELLADAQVGLWWYDPDAEEYVLSEDLKGRDRRLAGRVPLATLRALQHPDDAQREDEIRERLTREAGTAVGEVRYRMEDGSWLHLAVHYRSGGKTASGRYRMLGLSQNVTSVADARDQASVLAKRLHMALRAAKAGVYEYDYATRSAWLSPELEAMLSPDMLEGVRLRPLTMFRREDLAGIALSPTPDESGHVPPLECRLRHVGGDRWVKLYYDLEGNPDGSASRGVGLVIDIEEQKQRAVALEEARRAAEAATEAKSQFLASVSHDIRTPMNGIIGVLNLLGRERLSATGRQLTREAIACGEMLTRLINDILDLSKIEAGKMELSPEPTNVEEVLDSVINLLSPQAEDRGLYLRKRTAADLGGRLVDPVRLRQCLFNLIGNAVKFTETGGVEVRLSASDGAGGPRLRVEIEDTGVGVPEAAQARLFNMFQQAEAGTTKRFGGTGLGLAISRQLARLMGGDVDFRSRAGEGSMFWIEVAAPPAEQKATGGDVFGGAPLSGLRVLIVDDHSTNRLVGSMTVEAMGAQASTAADGAAAVDAVSRQPFDVVLMDVQMPGMDGLEATRRIRALAGGAGRIPVVALTADITSERRSACLAAGMDAVIIKPILPKHLLAAILPLVQAAPSMAEQPATSSLRA